MAASASLCFPVVPLLAQASTVLSPMLLFVLATAAAVGMMLLLPGRKESPFRIMGGVLLLGTLLVLATIVGKLAAGVGFYFWVFSAIAILGAVRVITHTKPVYSALYFVLTVMATAGLFVLMWAEFMAAALVLIYAGAILVTYVFVIMLAAESGEAGAGTEHDTVSREPVLASAVGFALMGMLLFVIFDGAPALDRSQVAVVNPAGASTSPVAAIADRNQPPVLVGATQQLGGYLFSNQIVNLELAGLILTVAMVGAIIIARRRVYRTADPFESTGPVLTAPATPIDDNPHSIPVDGTFNPREKAYPET